MVSVRYIGRKPSWTDRPSLYGSGLTFKQGQVRSVPDLLGKSLLRHADLFALALEEPIVQEVDTDDTEQVLAKAQADKDKAAKEEIETYDVLDNIARMDEGALVRYAHVKYGMALPVNGRKSKESRTSDLRRQVRELVERFGV